MNKEEIKIKEFDKQQLEILLNDLQDIDKFTGFKDGAFRYELGKYQANLLVGCIKKYKEVIDKSIEFIKAKYEEDYSQNNNYVPLEHLNLKNCSYERSLQVLDILKEVE